MRDIGEYESMRPSYYQYLVDLRDSGETNMWGAATYLSTQFKIPHTIAKNILLDWIESFDKADDQELKDEND